MQAPVGVPRPDRYEARALLGSGSMGVVYRVYDRLLECEVALKTLAHDDPQDLLLLKREFHALARVLHPNVVRLYDLEVEGSRGYFTMELVEGSSLLEALAGRGRRARDPVAVRRSFLQLVAGLSAIHTHGLLHRDVKPANVRMEPGGRVVLLDFGLALGTAHELSLQSRGQLAGTLAYMAPEQAWGQTLTASDWYSVGVMLYECLSGSLPFVGSSLSAFLDRDRPPAAPPRGPAADADPMLAEIALDLLSYDPERRPEGEAVLRRLEGRAAPRAPVRRTRPTPFVGREEERSRLRAAFARTLSRRAVVVRVEGPSGIGKSTFVEHILAELEEQGTLVLRSRCHVQAIVPFEALDGCVDELSRYLSHAKAEEREAVRPRGLRALQRVFPVLSGVPFEHLVQEPDYEASEPAELRRAAVKAMGELLARIAARRPLALWIDDFQWGDADSAPFLLELLSGPDAPPLLLVLSYRAEDRGQGSLLGPLLDTGSGTGVDLQGETVPLGPLAQSSLVELLGSVLDDADEERIRALAAQAEGSPLFALQLARSPRLSKDPGARLELGDVLRDRLADLSEDQVDLLRWVAIAGRPIGTSLLLELAAAGRRGRSAVYDLCRLGWLRPIVDQNRLDTLHHRIRQVVVEDIPEPQRRSRHLNLGRVLAAQEAVDASAVYSHYRIAGHPEAADWALRAAEEAERGLAFDRAAVLFREAFTLRGAPDGDWTLLERQGRALATDGRSSAASRIYGEAAGAAIRAGAPGLEAIRLRGSAAQQHLYAGELEEGTLLLRSVLEELGLGAPGRAAARRRQALLNRARFLLQEATGTLDRRSRAREHPLEPAVLLRLDILHGASRGLSMLDPSLADALAAQHLLAAVRAGEPSRLLRALGLEAGFEANVGGSWLRRHAMSLLDRVEALAERTGDPYDRAWALISRSNVAWFNAQWRECVRHGEEAVEWLRSRCIGIQWERTSNELFTVSAQAQMGELETLRRRIPELLEGARRRGDAYAVSACRTGDAGFVALADDDPERGLREAAEAGRPYDGGEFTSIHYYLLYPWVQIQIYRGTPDVAWRALEHAWPALERAGFLRLDCIGNGMRHLRARAAMATAGLLPESRRAPLLRVVRDEARRIARSTLPQSPGNAGLLRAGLAALLGDRATAGAELVAAAGVLERADMHLYAASARWQAGACLPPDAAREVRAEARRTFFRQAVRRPSAFAATLAPIG
jgi:hypothetical protein